tara:strand:+ start:396 stop:1001 length:606 start_codon:yes stop_codon:yes gene_type:complete
MITVIDYGMGNIGSILNMLKKINVKSGTTSETEKILSSKKIILPGVGAFDSAIKKIEDLGIKEALNFKVLEEKTPVLGICLGMQLMTNNSEEGNLNGLGWIDAETKLFPKMKEIKVPHMGWNYPESLKLSPLLEGIDKNFRFYFVHSYYVQIKKENESLMKSFHGITFDAVISKDNIYGVQFHPEKSHKFGLRILKNFSEI